MMSLLYQTKENQVRIESRSNKVRISINFRTIATFDLLTLYDEVTNAILKSSVKTVGLQRRQLEVRAAKTVTRYLIREDII